MGSQRLDLIIIGLEMQTDLKDKMWFISFQIIYYLKGK